MDCGGVLRMDRRGAEEVTEGVLRKGRTVAEKGSEEGAEEQADGC